MLGDALPQMVLRDDVDGELALLDLNIGVRPCCLQQATLNLLACVVLVVQDAELAVAALAVQIETVALVVEVEIHTVLHQLADAVGGFADGHLHHIAVADAVTCHQRVVDMFVERITVVHHSRYAALGITCAAFRGVALGEDAHLAIGRHLQGEAKACNA